MNREDLKILVFAGCVTFALIALTVGVVVLGRFDVIGAVYAFIVAALCFAGAWLTLPRMRNFLVSGLVPYPGVKQEYEAEIIARRLGFSFEDIKTDRLAALQVTRQKWSDIRLKLSLNEPLYSRIYEWEKDSQGRCALCWYRAENIKKALPEKIFKVCIGETGIIESCEGLGLCEDIEKTRALVLKKINGGKQLDDALLMCKRQSEEIVKALDEMIKSATAEAIEKEKERSERDES